MNWRSEPTLLTVGAVLCVTLLCGLMGSPRQGDKTVSATAAPNVVEVRFSGSQWHGKPVYTVTNHADRTLTHLTVYSWSEDLQPVLYIGADQPASLPALQPLTHPPYILPSRQSAWFVGTGLPPIKFALEWQDDGHVHYANVSVQWDTARTHQ